MFEISEKDIIGQSNKLLFNIWQELKGLKPIPQEVKPATKKPIQICEYCGKDHSLKGVAGVCARKRKRESDK